MKLKKVLNTPGVETLGQLLSVEFSKDNIVRQTQLHHGIFVCHDCKNFYPVESLNCNNIECQSPNPIHVEVNKRLERMKPLILEDVIFQFLSPTHNKERF